MTAAELFVAKLNRLGKPKRRPTAAWIRGEGPLLRDILLDIEHGDPEPSLYELSLPR